MGIPTVQQSIDDTLAALESALGQDSPLPEKSFLMILSRMEGILQNALYQYGENRVLQVLATTASLDGLVVIGAEYDIYLKLATPAELTATVTGTPGDNLFKTDTWKSPSNNVRYIQTQDYVIPGSGTVDISVIAQSSGVETNLEIGSILETTDREATVSGTTVLGSDQEDIEDFRTRVLDAKRNDGGGSNLADIRNWGQETPDVYRIYPYTGTNPGYRTVYVESTPEYDPDGLADAALLAAVRNYITYEDGDPTKPYRQAAGSTDDTLTIASITYVNYVIRIYNLKGLSEEARAEAEISIAEVVAQQAATFRPFVLGVDSVLYRNDRVTPVAISEAIQDVLDSYGAYAERVSLVNTSGLAVGSYLLQQGERISLGTDFIDV